MTISRYVGAFAAAFAFLLCVASGRQGAGTDQTSPLPRHGIAMAYDPARRCVVLFGGVNHLLKPSTRYNETWTWKGQKWTLASRTGPTARIWPSMASDIRNRKMLLFGGFDGKRCLGDSWYWDGERWSGLKPEPSPAPRWHFAMVTDRHSQTVVLFGGVDTNTQPPVVFGDTWLWDGAAWRHAADNGPTPRFAHAMAYDPNRSRIVLFGGRTADGQPLNDTWEWDGNSWTELRTVHAPGHRLLHAMAFDEHGDRLILIGGWDAREGGARYLPDAWQLKNGDWTKLETAGPPPMRAHFMVDDPRAREVLLFGGYDDNMVYGGTWVWNGTAWRKR